MRKLVGIFICMLLIGTVIPAIGSMNVKNYDYSKLKTDKPLDVPDYYLNGADQYLTSNCGYGDEIFPPLMAAQEFKPTKEDLTAVALGFFKSDPPSGLEITVSIRDALDGDDLAVKTVDADLIKKNFKETWLMFDFPDITLIPENTYFIVCSVNGGVANESILWFFNINNQYDRGIAWFSGDSGETWFDEENIPGWPQMDYCFITYYQEPPESTKINNYQSSEANYDFPEYFSWRDYEGEDWTTSAKNQGICGSCHIFGGIGALESVINIREGISDLNPDLSEQYVLSCLIPGGCSGGLPLTTFDRICRNDSTGNNCNGIIPEICFQYQADDTIPCDSKSDNWDNYLIPIVEYGYIQGPEIDEIKSKIMQYGPVASSMICTEKFFNWVRTNHNPDDYFPLDDESDYGEPHCVIIVGWKDDDSISNGGYWICKNSWGLDEGYNGFFNIEYKNYIGLVRIDWVDYDPDSYDWHPIPKSNGPYFGLVSKPVQFQGDASGEHPPFTFHWDFGDETYSEEQNPTHIYTSEGEFIVTITVTDELNNSFYDETYVWIQETNQPPNKPSLTGFPIATQGEFYYFNFIINDPDNSVVYYYYEIFGEDKGVWSDPIESGKESTAMWWTPTDNIGIKKIRVKAKDPYGAESEWATLPVAIPINKSLNIFIPIINRLIQRFPIFEFIY